MFAVMFAVPGVFEVSSLRKSDILFFGCLGSERNHQRENPNCQTPTLRPLSKQIDDIMKFN